MSTKPIPARVHRLRAGIRRLRKRPRSHGTEVSRSKFWLRLRLTALRYLHSFPDDMSGTRVRKQLIWLLLQKHSRLIPARISAHKRKEIVRNLTLGWDRGADLCREWRNNREPCPHVKICLLSTAFYDLRRGGGCLLVLQPLTICDGAPVSHYRAPHLPGDSCVHVLLPPELVLKSLFESRLPSGSAHWASATF